MAERDGPPTRPPHRGGGFRLGAVLVLLVAGVLSSGSAEPFGNTNGAHYGFGSAGGDGGGGGGGVGIHVGGGINLGLGELVRCPKVCSCNGQSVDCSRRGLTQVPRRIPLDTEKL